MVSTETCKRRLRWCSTWLMMNTKTFQTRLQRCSDLVNRWLQKMSAITFWFSSCLSEVRIWSMVDIRSSPPDLHFLTLCRSYCPIVQKDCPEILLFLYHLCRNYYDYCFSDHHAAGLANASIMVVTGMNFLVQAVRSQHCHATSALESSAPNEFIIDCALKHNKIMKIHQM